MQRFFNEGDTVEYIFFCTQFCSNNFFHEFTHSRHSVPVFGKLRRSRRHTSCNNSTIASHVFERSFQYVSPFNGLMFNGLENTHRKISALSRYDCLCAYFGYRFMTKIKYGQIHVTRTMPNMLRFNSNDPCFIPGNQQQQ